MIHMNRLRFLLSVKLCKPFVNDSPITRFLRVLQRKLHPQKLIHHFIENSNSRVRHDSTISYPAIRILLQETATYYDSICLIIDTIFSQKSVVQCFLPHQ